MGTVTLDQQPLPRGTVQFVPDTTRSGRGPTAVGTIADDGTYELETAGAAGAMVGFHRVRVTAQHPPKDETDTLPRSLIPLRYNDPNTSGLEFEVKSGSTNTINLELTSND